VLEPPAVLCPPAPPPHRGDVPPCGGRLPGVPVPPPRCCGFDEPLLCVPKGCSAMPHSFACSLGLTSQQEQALG